MYPSVDQLQKALAERVFHNRQDTKKAAGRALGTIVELITFYLLRQWRFSANLTIELALPEFGNPAITHNVEFGLHEIAETKRIELPKDQTSITSRKMLLAIGDHASREKSNVLVSAKGVLRNACVLREEDDSFLIANLVGQSGEHYQVEIVRLRKKPFAMVECKRVGVEDGAKKGPTTIEKAKQGAYVAKHVSSLQKIRAFDGEMFGAMAKPDGSIQLRPWKNELKRLVYKGSAEELAGFILTVGVVSNHGNWFTGDDPNKELLVLKQSYDWLLFLNDGGIAEFVQDILLSDSEETAPVRRAFEESYAEGRKAGDNKFTKVRIALDAHECLSKYVAEKIDHIESRWFSVLSPGGESIKVLKEELAILKSRR